MRFCGSALSSDISIKNITYYSIHNNIMPWGDIGQFFRPSSRISSPQRVKKRAFEFPMEKP